VWFLRVDYLEDKEIASLVDYTKKYKISHSNLINKDKRQTIEAFSEKSKWKIGWGNVGFSFMIKFRSIISLIYQPRGVP
jgi:hypothetical protein